MIELSPSMAMIIYLALTLFMLFGIWIYYHYQSRTKKVILSEKKLFICEYCHFAYLDRIEKRITQCPQCQSLNELK